MKISKLIFTLIAYATTINAFAGSTPSDEVTKYRQLLSDESPAYFWEMSDEVLWNKKIASSNNAPIEHHDLWGGLGKTHL